MQNILINFIMIVLVNFLFDYYKSKRMYNKFNKEKQEMMGDIDAIHPNDKVLVAGSIVATVEKLEEEFLVLKLSEDTTIKVLKNTVIKFPGQ